MARCSLRFFAATLVALLTATPVVTGNKTATWLDKRGDLIDKVYGYGKGVLPTQSVPDAIKTWPEDTDPRSAGLRGLVWNMSTLFEITSTVFYSPASGDASKRSTSAFLFHHGHSNCVCADGTTALTKSKCAPGCVSSMPSKYEDPGEYTWWDLYNVSTFYHALGHDVFILSMPLKGINLGPGMEPGPNAKINDNHWWFLQWEQMGDAALRYFLEPAYLTVNYAVANGYEEIHMAGLSGGGWTTTFAAAIDKRITGSFPIAGSVPCSMRNPLGHVVGQNWTGNDDEDFEQSCNTPNASYPIPPVLPVGSGPDGSPGRAAFLACNYTCQYLLAGLEPTRYQVQLLHEYDTCCFSPHNRHSQMLAYEHNIRAELSSASDGRSKATSHGWFTTIAVNHSKHEVAAQEKRVMAAVLAAAAAAKEQGKGSELAPGAPAWDQFPCDVMHQPLPGGDCAQDVEPGLVEHAADYVPLCPTKPCTCTRLPEFPCLS